MFSSRIFVIALQKNWRFEGLDKFSIFLFYLRNPRILRYCQLAQLSTTTNALHQDSGKIVIYLYRYTSKIYSSN
jgi:hypothetical protein